MELTRLSELKDRGVPLTKWLEPERDAPLQCERCEGQDLVAPLAHEPGEIYDGVTVVCVTCGVVHEGWTRANGTALLQPAGLLTRTALAALRRLLGRPRSTWWAP